MFFNVAALLSLAAGASAHMLLAYPPPFSGLQNGPIDETRPFPCQQKFAGGTPTSMSLGSTQRLTFTGGASHGGGSCQVSITYDKNPSASTKWKVITSIHGGCVANVDGNVGGDASAALDSGLKFKIPDNIPAGPAIFSWSWINRIGNREFYQNCAPIVLTGTGGSMSNFEKLPDMFITNIPGNSACQTPEGKDYIYPNPGQTVFTNGPADRLFKLQCGATSSDDSSTTTPSTPSKDTGAAPVASAAPQNPAGGVKAPAPAPDSADTDGSDGTLPTGPSTPATPEAAPATPEAAPATPEAAPATPATPNKSVPSTGASDSTPAAPANPATPATPATGSDSSDGCELGTYKCGADGASFVMCGSGRKWSPVMRLAIGTTCTPGNVGNRPSRRMVAFRA